VDEVLESARGQALRPVPGGPRRGLVLRLDRRAGQRHRRRLLHAALDPAQEGFILVCGERREGEAAHRGGPDDASGARGVRGARPGQARYSGENHAQELPAEFEARFKANRPAWDFWQKQPPSYRKTAAWLVVSAKRPETRERRMQLLIGCSARGERIPQLVAPAKKRPAAHGKPPPKAGTNRSPSKKSTKAPRSKTSTNANSAKGPCPKLP
jgi:hypothetical protein